VTRRDAKAIHNDIALNEWQIEEITKGVAEAERGDFASDEEVEQTLKEWIPLTR
jgi:RHH-type transcriptional regulator, rel operon repressor / antitoxin RelB